MSRAKEAVVAVMSCFRPTREVVANVRLVQALGIDLVVVDDGSGPAFESVLEEVRGMGIAVLALPENVGLGRALNEGVARARALFDASHVLTLDQDTRLSATFLTEVSATLQAASRASVKVGLVGAGIINGHAVGDTWTAGGLDHVVEAIQSGFVVPVTVLDEVGPFEESYFIDLIDIEYLFRLRRAGYVTLVSPRAAIEHSIGERLTVAILGHSLKRQGASVSFSYHPPFRRYYINRNRVALFRAYGRSNSAWVARKAFMETKVFAASLLFGRERLSQVRAAVAGLRDGLRGVDGRIPWGLERALVLGRENGRRTDARP
ncbi:glycosyltransferase [Frigoribacterium sp. NBH87]|jgi:rhamnosyltransferase|nr:glycosyltransferase [Frigoribacterium sp. NBH87]